MFKQPACIVFILATVLMPWTVSAHHSRTAFFDQSRIVEVEGVITRVLWRHPHVRFWMQTDEGVQWELESTPPSILEREGITRDLWAVGERVRVGGAPAREVEIRTYQAALDVCDCPRPQTEYQAKFSLQHTVATALLDGRLGLDSFDEAARKRAADLGSRVRVSAADPYKSNYPDSWGAELEVVGESGDSYRVSRKDCRGDPELALDAGEMRDKALGLLHYGGLDEAVAGKICDTVLALPSTTSRTRLFSDFRRYIGIA